MTKNKPSTSTPKRRGRPPKNAVSATPTPKRRGRPPKNAKTAVLAAPKRRGRPPKNAKTAVLAAPKRRGRPPKKNTLGRSPLRTPEKQAQVARIGECGRGKPKKIAEKKTAELLFCAIVELCDELFKRPDFEDFVSSVPETTAVILTTLYDYVHPSDNDAFVNVEEKIPPCLDEDSAPYVTPDNSVDEDEAEVIEASEDADEDEDDVDEDENEDVEGNTSFPLDDNPRDDIGDAEFLNKPETETQDGSLLSGVGSEENTPDQFLDSMDSHDTYGALGHTDDESGE